MNCLTRPVLTILFMAVCATDAFAQSAPEFIARRDIQFSGEIIAEAGDLVVTEPVTGDKVTLVLADGKRAAVQRSELADMNEAVAVLTSLIQREPKTARLYSARANVWAIKKDFPKAIADATLAIEHTDPPDAVLFLNRGAFHTSTGDHTKAAADYVKATHIDPKFYPAYTSLAAAYIGRREFDKAIELCTSVIKVDEKNPAHYVQRGVAYRQKKEWDAAIADFSKALEFDRDNLAALGSRGFVSYLKGDHAAAVQDFDTIIKLTPNDAMAYNNRGYNHFLNKDCRSALKDFDRAIELLPTYATAYQNKAWMLATCADDEVRNGAAAVAAAQKAIEQRKSRVAADIKSLAAAYAETGDFANAITYQTQVVDMMTPDNKAAEQQVLTQYKEKKPYRSQPVEVAKSN
ncbi:MAG: tetratricopeptide repeat protein [Planctomycetaceae bacterium]